MKKSKPQQTWKAGDCFAIPLNDGGCLLGQVLANEPLAMNSVACALFNQRVGDGESPLPKLDLLFSTLLATRGLLDAGQWKVIGSHPIQVPRRLFPFEGLRQKGFVGAKVIGSQNVMEFANAFSGLVAWNDWADPNYLDGLLISPAVKPANLKYKAKDGHDQ